MEKNTSKTWNEVWGEPFSEERERYFIEIQKRTILWKRIIKEIIKEFGSFKGLKSIELGAGGGIDSLLFAMEGADVTVLDYSEKALEKAKKNFNIFGLKANFIQMDALNLEKNLQNKFDVSMSYGVAEHFIGENRITFIKTHFNVLKKGGLAFISLPNKYNLIYRFWMFLSKLFGRWQFGEEYPFSRSELKSIGRKLGIKFEIIGGYLLLSKFKWKRRIRKWFGLPPDYDASKLKKQFGTPFDKYLSYELCIVGKK